MTATFETFDPLMHDAQVAAMLRLCESQREYGSYAEDVTNEISIAPDLPQRYDAAANFLNTGGRFGRREDVATLVARTNYFRETYAYDASSIDGIGPFLNHPGFIAAARKIHDRTVVVPNIVYANILVPGQELAVHTDVPEFRGADRHRFPQWLLVVMHHSGLFAKWRRHIATGVAYFSPCEGGAFAFYPEGPQAAARTLPVKANTAILLDTDTVFHGVDRVAETQPLPPLVPGMKLRFENGGWFVRDGDATVANYTWDEVRFSVSWKAYCYASEDERTLTEQHRDDLDLDTILRPLLTDLYQRGVISSADRPASDHDLALTLIREYIEFPASNAGAA
ncbi:MAG: hypothetical protein WBG86_21625 [Polyangiales bacterium]